VLFPKDLKISKSMKQIIRRGEFNVTFNQNFEEVISNCKTVYREGQGGTWITNEMQQYREGQGGTWITNEMQQAYIELHEKGIAKSVEVWLGDELVGGLYGIDLGPIFCGESMFSLVSNASKLAFISLTQKLEKEHYKLIDCQVYNPHLESLGADEISRDAFLKILKQEK